MTERIDHLRLLSRWERNMYDDSDFLAAAWDTEARVLRLVLEGSTRFAGGHEAALAKPSEAELADAKAALRAWLTDAVKAHTRADFTDPQSFDRGELVRAKRRFKSRKTGVIVEPGDEGRIVWWGEMQSYGRDIGVRVGVQYANGQTVFHDANVVSRTAPRDFSHVIEREMRDLHWRVAVDTRYRLRFPS